MVIGKGHCGELLTIVERQTGFTVLTRLDEKPTKTVTAATIALSASFKYPVLTITADNGENLNCDVYFTGPYFLWQRGLNETPIDVYDSILQNQQTLKRYRNRPLRM
jgi:IS30 family transposase